MRKQWLHCRIQRRPGDKNQMIRKASLEDSGKTKVINQARAHRYAEIFIAHMPHIDFHTNRISMQDVCPMNLV